MKMLPILIIHSILYSLISCLDHKSLELDIVYSINGMRVEICVGTPPKCFQAGISLTRFFTWIVGSDDPKKTNTKYSSSASSTNRIQINNAAITFENNKKVIGNHIEESMHFGNTIVSSLQILSSFESKDFEQYEGILSLGFIPTETESHYSILTQLYDKAFIDNKVFSIYMTDKDKSKGRLVLGSIPSHIHHQRGYKTCPRWISPPNNETQRWECTLKTLKISYNNDFIKDLFSVETAIGFDYNVEYILVPLHMLVYLERTIFLHYTIDKTCSFEIRKGYHVFVCTNDAVSNDFKEMRFTLENLDIVLPKEKFFHYDPIDKQYYFILACEENAFRNDIYVLGNTVLNLFVMVYNEEDQNIGFYSGDEYRILIQENGNNGDSNGETGEIEEKDKEFIPLFQQDDGESNSDEDKVIPNKGQLSFGMKFIVTFGSIIAVLTCLIVIWMLFRYYRRKNYAKKQIDYNRVNEIFN